VLILVANPVRDDEPTPGGGRALENKDELPTMDCTREEIITGEMYFLDRHSRRTERENKSGI